MSLTIQEMEFFADTVARVRYSVNVHCPIEPMDHDQLKGKHKEALGCCWKRIDDENGALSYLITIDEYFIHECFVAIEKPYMKIEPQTLEQVIAHEIAHLHHWRHGKKHNEMTAYIVSLIESGKPHGIE